MIIIVTISWTEEWFLNRHCPQYYNDVNWPVLQIGVLKVQWQHLWKQSVMSTQVYLSSLLLLSCLCCPAFVCMWYLWPRCKIYLELVRPKLGHLLYLEKVYICLLVSDLFSWDWICFRFFFSYKSLLCNCFKVNSCSFYLSLANMLIRFSPISELMLCCFALVLLCHGRLATWRKSGSLRYVAGHQPLL